MEIKPNIAQQEGFYTERWNQFAFANKLDLARITAVLESGARRVAVESWLPQDFQHALDRSSFALVVGHLVLLLGVLGSFQGERDRPAISTQRWGASGITERTLYCPDGLVSYSDGNSLTAICVMGLIDVLGMRLKEWEWRTESHQEASMAFSGSPAMGRAEASVNSDRCATLGLRRT